jgi:hypothetical protein
LRERSTACSAPFRTCLLPTVPALIRLPSMSDLAALAIASAPPAARTRATRAIAVATTDGDASQHSVT